MKDLYEKERKEWLASLAGQRFESNAEMVLAGCAWIGFVLLCLSILTINK